MNLKFKVKKEYIKKYAEDLKDTHEKIKTGDHFAGYIRLERIVHDILGNYGEKIQKLWDKYPKMTHMGFKFELNDVFLGESLHSLVEEAEQKYKGKNFEPLLDYILDRYPAILVL